MIKRKERKRESVQIYFYSTSMSFVHVDFHRKVEANNSIFQKYNDNDNVHSNFEWDVLSSPTKFSLSRFYLFKRFLLLCSKFIQKLCTIHQLQIVTWVAFCCCFWGGRQTSVADSLPSIYAICVVLLLFSFLIHFFYTYVYVSSCTLLSLCLLYICVFDSM